MPGPLAGLSANGSLAALLAVVAMAVVVALPVGAATQPRLGKHFFVNLALLAQADFGFKLVDFAAERLGKLALEAFFPDGVAGFHGKREWTEVG